jgi:hypothetical protein
MVIVRQRICGLFCPKKIKIVMAQSLFYFREKYFPAQDKSPEGILAMLPGFDKIVEERIQAALRKGEFDNLPGSGKPLDLEETVTVPEDLRVAYKILKNADYIPPELELKKEIRKTEELLSGMEDTAEKYKVMKKLNYLVMKVNLLRNAPVMFEESEVYSEKLIDKFGRK